MVISRLHALVLTTALIIYTPSLALAQRDIRTEQVRFDRGSSSATVEGSIAGYEIVDYVLNAKQGQYINVSMATDHTSNYFNILLPGGNEEALFNGSMGENQYEGSLPESGNYKVRVYLMRNAARRDEVANYRLEMIISNEEDAIVAGTNYNATGEIPCAMSLGQPTNYCSFGVTRAGNGSGLVTITKPNGDTRTIFFENGEAVGYDVNQASEGEFSAEKQADLNIIRIGQERYEIPDAVIFGG